MRFATFSLLSLACLLWLAGCGGGSDRVLQSAPSSTVVASNASPATGNATLTAIAEFASNTNFGDQVTLVPVMGSDPYNRNLVVDLVPGTHALGDVQYVWDTVVGGSQGGLTDCGIHGCSHNNIAIDFANKKITFTNLTLDGTFDASQTATLNGSIVWQ